MNQKQAFDTGYVLHRRRYRETSLIVELFTRGHGRVSAVAKGAMRPKSPLGACLQPLTPVRLTLRGRHELMNLHAAEASGPAYVVTGDRLYSVMYVNELLTKLTAVHDPHPELLDVYEATLTQIASAAALEPSLRSFEYQLLEHIGFGMQVDADARTGEALDAERIYRYIPEHGAVQSAQDTVHVAVTGACLIALAGRGPWSPDSLAGAKTLMRRIIDHHLDGRPLKTRELFAASRQRSA